MGSKRRRVVFGVREIEVDVDFPKWGGEVTRVSQIEPAPNGLHTVGCS